MVTIILKEHGFAKINKAAEIASQSLAMTERPTVTAVEVT